MAEALARARYPGAEVWSAGLAPYTHVMPEVHRALEEVGLSVPDLHPKPLSALPRRRWHLAVALDPAVAAFLPPAEHSLVRPFPDPFGQDLAVYRALRDALLAFLEELDPFMRDRS